MTLTQRNCFGSYLLGPGGGINRISIIELLIDQPYNINQLSDIIKIDYKAIQHHIHVLEKNNLITKEGEKYGILYFISNYLEANMEAFREVIDKIQKSKKK